MYILALTGDRPRMTRSSYQIPPKKRQLLAIKLDSCEHFSIPEFSDAPDSRRQGRHEGAAIKL
jgi:hypothetical protein